MSVKKILIVDDEEHMRELLKDFFEGEGFVVDVAEDGVKALEKLSEITVEAVENLDEAWFYDLRGERWIRFERLKSLT